MSRDHPVDRDQPHVRFAGINAGIGRIGDSVGGLGPIVRVGLIQDLDVIEHLQWQIQFTLPVKGDYVLMVRCTNSQGVAQPAAPNWNPSGFMRNVIEAMPVVAD
jgi:hypothetical protein